MLMQDKFAFVSGVANRRSIAWAIARSLDAHGAHLALSYLGDREKAGIEKLAKDLSQPPLIVPCEATSDDSVAAAFDKVGSEFGRLDAMVHSIAFARREDLEHGRFLHIDSEGYQLALSVSAYSLNSLSRGAVPLMPEEGGSILAMTFLGSVRAIPRYNVMGVAKAALESGVRYLARELGEKNIRVNALSSGPVKTLASRGIGQFNIMLQTHAERSALKRNVTVEEVGNSALFLCSELSSGITGEIIYVDAGYQFMGM
jgi:enoyl-[acyl-carrier protein] reductase I